MPLVDFRAAQNPEIVFRYFGDWATGDHPQSGSRYLEHGELLLGRNSTRRLSDLVIAGLLVGSLLVRHPNNTAKVPLRVSSQWQIESTINLGLYLTNQPACILI